MKIVLISSSPHKNCSQTFLLAKKALEGCLSQGAKLEIIHLSDYKVSFCRHCELCHKESMRCAIDDDVPEILGKILDSDGVILATPNYINQVTGSMKTLFDRSGSFIHCKRLLGKYVSGVVTSGSGCDTDVLEYIKYYGHICGAQYSGGVSCSAPAPDEKKKEAFSLGQKLAADILNKKNYPKQVKVIEKGRDYFSKIVQMRKNEWPAEYQYWKQKGWI